MSAPSSPPQGTGYPQGSAYNAPPGYVPGYPPPVPGQAPQTNQYPPTDGNPYAQSQPPMGQYPPPNDQGN